jgi:hypothetical protein
MSENDALARRLQRARGYPYAFPRESFVYRDSGNAPFDPALTAGRTPVLAIGSNQSPERLAQKFGHDASHVIPVERARLDGFDVVYSAHVTSYGAIPAMLQVCAGAAVSVAVTWLNEAQLAIMHESEIAAANYAFAELADVRVVLDSRRESPAALAYVSSRGCLTHDGEPVALAAIECIGRRFAAMHTHEVLERVRVRVAPDLSADAFIHRLLDDSAWRDRITAALALDAGTFSHPVRVLS